MVDCSIKGVRKYFGGLLKTVKLKSEIFGRKASSLSFYVVAFHPNFVALFMGINRIRISWTFAY